MKLDVIFSVVIVVMNFVVINESVVKGNHSHRVGTNQKFNCVLLDFALRRLF